MKGTKAIAQRIINAENAFIDYAKSKTGISDIAAEKVLEVYKKVKAIKIDPVTGQFTFTHGDFADKDPMLEALKHYDKIMKKPVRRKNPVSKSRKVKKGIELFRLFREEEPEFIETVDYNTPDVAMLIGYCDAVEYTTSRGGKVELYRHEFDRKSRPLLASTHDGKQLLVLGGRYNFTEDGIKDY